MKTIIAGCRTLTMKEHFTDVLIAVKQSGFDITEVVSGKAKGADTLGEKYAKLTRKPIKEFPADWDTHGKSAGMIRNNQMAAYGECLIAMWDGKSRGTLNMINSAHKKNLPIHIHMVQVEVPKKPVEPAIEQIQSAQPFFVYTDGSSKKTKHGGWGCLVKTGDKVIENSGAASETTNNRMELTAVIRGIQSTPVNSKVTVISDSLYAITGITEWIFQWMNNDWRKTNGKPAKNKDLWLELLEIVQQRDIDWEWVRGHTGHPENERADDLACQAAERLRDAETR